MNTKLVRALPAVTVLAVVVAVSASTGAVAGSLITGADIKNGSVASADIKNQSILSRDVKNQTLTAADMSAATITQFTGLNGLQRVENSKAILAGADGTVVVACPPGTRMLGLAADWTNSVEPTATWLDPNLTSGVAYASNNTGSTKTLRATATCATTN